MTKIRKNLQGKLVKFHGYDGKDYVAFVEHVQNGYAKLRYQAVIHFERTYVHAYINDASRIEAA